MAKESSSAALLRLQKLEVIQNHWSEFLPFLHDVMDLLGFPVSEIQEDIAKFIAYGPQWLMVKAQRGQAKTTIAAALCVWSLIHDPKTRCLIVSAGGSQASDISTLIVRIIQTMPELECMRPDVRNGDRSSVEHFDVHYSLKGVDKSPSVKCIGITANLQGNRADILLADDVESSKNSATALQRAQLLQLTLDFSSICSTGRIIYLGTPQSQDSIYSTLPGRGFTVRVWPGRYPTAEQLDNYGAELAPMLARRLAAEPSLGTGGGALGDQGQPIEQAGTGWLDEANLQAKEADQGASWFQLQHMLNTKLADALRFPLKPDAITIMDIQPRRVPLLVTRSPNVKDCQDYSAHGFAWKHRMPGLLGVEWAPLVAVHTYIDPAGGGANADATAYATLGFLNSQLFLLDWGCVPGGYDVEVLRTLAQRVKRWAPQRCIIEKNMGFGAFKEVFQPVLQAVHKCGIDDDLVTGQKEKRIIATLEPVIGRGALIFTPPALEQMKADSERYAPKDRQLYHGVFQLAKVTHAKGALVHDDALDALEGAVRSFQSLLVLDDKKQAEQAAKMAYEEMVRDPMGRHRFDPPSARKGMLARWGRR